MVNQPDRERLVPRGHVGTSPTYSDDEYDIVIASVLPRAVEAIAQTKLHAAYSGALCGISQEALRGSRIVAPRKLRSLALAHEGHLRIVGSKQAKGSIVWWLGIDTTMENKCKKCHGCQIVARPERTNRTTTLPVGPWRTLESIYLTQSTRAA